MDVISSACPNASMLGKRGKVTTEALFCIHLINVTVSDSPQHNCYPGFDQAEGKNGSKPGSLCLGLFLQSENTEKICKKGKVNKMTTKSIGNIIKTI